MEKRRTNQPGLGINKATFYNWRKQYGGMEVSQLKELKELRRECQVKTYVR
ncbi:MAG: transposase [Saprospiraceae bacterium]|nr:transposase [Saprospiraceae bacterium]